MDRVGIANRALSLLGANRVTSLDPPYASVEAELAATTFDPVVRSVLEVRDWTFAKTRFTVAANVETPAFDYDYSFTIPSTVLRLVEVTDATGRIDAFMASMADQVDAGLDWVREGNLILAKTTATSLQVTAIQVVDDPMLWTPGFCEAVWTRLASELCAPLTQDTARALKLLQVYELKLKEASSADGRQGRSQRLRSTYVSRRR